MFGRFFKSPASPEKVNDAVNYFFAFSLKLLKTHHPFNLSESEKYDFRHEYILTEGIDNYGVGFFWRIELESTNFTNHHFSLNASHQIQNCCKPTLDKNNPMVEEVVSYLKNII